MEQWELNLEDGSLSNGDVLTSLSPKAAEVLQCLINGAGAILSRDQILRDVWKDLHISPDLVREYIFEIRKTLGDNATQPKYVETVGRRGFRLIGPVSIRLRNTPAKSADGEDHKVSSGRPVKMPTVKFCQSKDGASIAHAVSGESNYWKWKNTT